MTRRINNSKCSLMGLSLGRGEDRVQKQGRGCVLLVMFPLLDQEMPASVFLTFFKININSTYSLYDRIQKHNFQKS